MITKVERKAGPAADSLQICALSDGRAGNARQAIALAGALAADGRRHAVPLQPRSPWR
jgi:uncharacterized protein